MRGEFAFHVDDRQFAVVEQACGERRVAAGLFEDVDEVGQLARTARSDDRQIDGGANRRAAAGDRSRRACRRDRCSSRAVRRHRAVRLRAPIRPRRGRSACGRRRRRLRSVRRPCVRRLRRPRTVRRSACAASSIRSGLRSAAEFTLTLSQPARSRSFMSSTVWMPPPTANGIVSSAATARTTAERRADGLRPSP